MSSLAVLDARLTYQRAAEDLRENPGQWTAYESRGNCVILAGPGSGKTKTLTIKMARMLAEDVRPPSGIACITYSTECARELERRLSRLGIEPRSNVFIGTVHSFCLKNVVLPFGPLCGLGVSAEFGVASVTDQDRIFSGVVRDLMGAEENPAWVRTTFDRYRRTFIDRNSPEFRETNPQMASMICTYEDRLVAEKLIDFDCMVLWGLRIIEENLCVRGALRARFPALVVDEYQDLGLPLHRLVVALCKTGGMRLLAVGDQDQSIYGFTGAMPELLERLAGEEWVEQVRLRFNYRCGSQIVAASLKTLGQERGYESKAPQQGVINFHHCPGGIEDQARAVCAEIIPSALGRVPNLSLGRIGVLYLDRHDGEVIATAAERAGFKYIRIDGGAAYRKTPLTRWLEDCATWCAGGWQRHEPRLKSLIHEWLAFNRATDSTDQRGALRLVLVEFLFGHRNPRLTLATWLTQMYAVCLASAFKSEPRLRDEQEAFKQLVKAASANGRLSGFDLGAFSGQSGSPDHLNFFTLHSAKGLEFDVVIMIGLEQGKLPRWNARTAEAKREPRRLFYVGLTRAKHEVHLLYSGFTVNRSGQRFDNGPSEFLSELQTKLGTSAIEDVTPF